MPLELEDSCHCPRGIAVVVYDQDPAMARVAASLYPYVLRRLTRLGCNRGYAHGEFASVTKSAAENRYRPAVQFDETSHECQSNSETAPAAVQ